MNKKPQSHIRTDGINPRHFREVIIREKDGSLIGICWSAKVGPAISFAKLLRKMSNHKLRVIVRKVEEKEINYIKLNWQEI